jgi:hypothetical protein
MVLLRVLLLLLPHDNEDTTCITLLVLSLPQHDLYMLLLLLLLSWLPALQYLQVDGVEWEALVALQPVIESHGRLRPLDAVRKLDLQTDDAV